MRYLHRTRLPEIEGRTNAVVARVISDARAGRSPVFSGAGRRPEREQGLALRFAEARSGGRADWKGQVGVASLEAAHG